MTRTIAALILSCTALAGCLNAALPVENLRPSMRWDHRAEAHDWTARTMVAVADEDAKLALSVPQDITIWCPGYPEASLAERRAFWAGLLSALAKHESTWNPQASGGGGRWIGLTQIAPATARQYGCEARTTAALKDGAANLACAVEIMAVNVANDRLVAGERGTRGLGRDWAPFRKAAKRADMAAWTAAQPYCRAGA